MHALLAKIKRELKGGASLTAERERERREDGEGVGGWVE